MKCPPDQIDYQVARHTDMHMRQWPKADAEKVRVECLRMLKAGQCWLWPAPQMELFQDEPTARSSAYGLCE